MTPGRPPAALTRRRPQVDCCLLFFFTFRDPGEGCGGLRLPCAAATSKNPETPFFIDNQPPPLHPRPHPTLKCVLDAIADRRSRRAKGRGPKCDDTVESTIRGLDGSRPFFLMEASERAPKASTLIHNVNVEVPKRSWAAGMIGGDVIGVGGRRGGGAADAPWPSRLWGGRCLPTLPRVEEIRPHGSTLNSALNEP